jgi:hypothetical protein
MTDTLEEQEINIELTTDEIPLTKPKRKMTVPKSEKQLAALKRGRDMRSEKIQSEKQKQKQSTEEDQKIISKIKQKQELKKAQEQQPISDSEDDSIDNYTSSEEEEVIRRPVKTAKSVKKSHRRPIPKKKKKIVYIESESDTESDSNSDSDYELPPPKNRMVRRNHIDKKTVQDFSGFFI